MIKYLLISLSSMLLAIHFSHSEKGEQNERCQCGRFFRNKNATEMVAGKLYDTIAPLQDGLDSQVVHAYSPTFGRCFAIKHCLEQPQRLNKCTRELEVLRAFNGSTNAHLLKFFDEEVKTGQICMESGLWSDYLRMIVIGGDRRRKRSETEINNCTAVNTVMELGLNDVDHYSKMWKGKNISGQTMQKQVQTQIQEALDELHNRGVSHRDVHSDNVLVFTPPRGNQSDQLLIKLIDFGWSCCFDPAKCAPRLSEILPKCEEKEALADDRFGLNDLVAEIGKN